MTQVINTDNGNWTDTFRRTDTPVIAHTPDETGYHQYLMGGATTIPRANDDGTSKGFDPNSAGVVHVDPAAADGGAVVDLSRLTRQTIENAMLGSSGPAHVYYNLSQLSKAAEDVRQQQLKQSPNPKQAGYVVPRSNTDGIQVAAQAGDQVLPSQRSAPLALPAEQVLRAPPAPSAIPEQATVSERTSPVPTTDNYSFPDHVIQRPPPIERPAELTANDQLARLTEAVSQLVAVSGSRQPCQPEPSPPAGQPVRKESPSKVELDSPPASEQALIPQPPRELQARDKSPDYRGYLKSLNIDFLAEGVPQPPRKQVIFELSGFGMQSARFHEVVDNGTDLLLVYDTRFELGTQYVPPNQAELENPAPFWVTCQELKNKCQVNGFGQHFRLGVIDLIVLVKVPA